jgi:hypothetical protein
MGRYFNKGRGSLPLTLSDGKSVSVPGNSWIVLEGRDETTASVRRAVRKEQLFQQIAKKQPAASATKKTEVKTTATPAGEEAPADTAAEESKPTEAAPKKARRSRARATAE